MKFNSSRFIMMGPVFTILSMIYYFFLLKYTFDLFGGLNTYYLLAIVICIGIITLGSVILEMKKSTFFGRTLMEISELWKWASLILLFDIIAIYILKIFIEPPQWLMIGIIAIVPIIGIYSYYKAHHIVIKEHTLKVANLKEDLDIVHLSDVHIGSIRNKKLLNNLAKELNELYTNGSDLAIISGDLADGSCDIPLDTFMPLANVDMPIIFTPGNHDFYPGIENVINAAKKAGLIVLDNETNEFKGLNILGLTYSFSEIETLSYEELANSVNSEIANLVIYHIPDSNYWELFKKVGFDIQLAGHTHGGQFYPANIWVSMIFPLCKGIFKNSSSLKDNYLSVTTGVGTMGPPMRWGTESELVVLKLRKE